jgi:CspA family cold shock protein
LDAPKRKKDIFMSITGTVKFFNADKGYGFVAPDDGSPDAFVHITAVERAGLATLREKDRITYDLEQDRRGKMAAVNIAHAE